MKKALKTATVTAALAMAATVALTGCEEIDLDSLLEEGGSSEPLTTSAPTSEKMVSDAKSKIDSLDTVAERPDPDEDADKNPGQEVYDRGCGEGEGCVFGPRWTDDQDAPLGHNGCDTRNDVLAQQLDNVEYKEGSDCVVTYGTYIEPYFGTKEEFIKGEPQKDQDEIDHSLPLSLGWDLGMFNRSIEERKAFANDAEYNLVVSTNAANAGGHDIDGDGEYDASKGEYPPKSDKAAYEWLPYLTDSGRACDFGARYVLVADRYDLPILEADKEAIEEAFSRC